MPRAHATNTTQVLGTKRQSEFPLVDAKRRAELPGGASVDSGTNLAIQTELRRSRNTNARFPDESVTRLFSTGIDRQLSRLDNPLLAWEVARSIHHWPLEQQHKVLASDLPSDPRYLNLNSIVPEWSVEDSYDTHLSNMIDQIEHDMRAKGPSTPISPIENLVRSGQVRFNIELVSAGNDITLKLCNAHVGASNELLRTYGSDSWIQVQIHEATLTQIQWEGRRHGIGDIAWQFFHRCIRFSGRTYRSALVKDESVWFFTSPLHCPRPIHVTDMIEKQLPIDLNPRMKISKFNARLQLGLSTTTPSIGFKPEQIRRIPDIYSNSLRISKTLMQEISDKFKLSYIPTAIAGAHKVLKAKYTGQEYSWGLFEPDGLPNDILIELWNSDHISFGTENKIMIEFRVVLYDPTLERWVEKTCDLEIPRFRIKVLSGKRSGEAMMTDGAAAIGWGAAMQIRTSLGLDYLPAAYQARILKSKGLWYLSKDPDKRGIWIEIRSSQWKGDVICQPNESLMFNICQVSSRAKAGHVNRQSIPVLVSRNVPASHFSNRQREAYQQILGSLTSTNSVKLTHALESQGNLVNIKAKRLATAKNAYVRNSGDEIGNNYAEKYSNRPVNPIEEAVELLRSGFSPRHHRVLDRVFHAAKQMCEKMLNFKIEVPSSTTVYAIPDPTGTLQEGEVVLNLSKFRDPTTLLPINTLKCDCIVSRSPCVLPYDVRRVKAVPNKHLLYYQDILVCSIYGDKSLLDHLSGGDYDGDVVNVIWDVDIVKDFVNADDTRDPIPIEKYNSFFSDMTTLAASGKASSLATMKVQDFRDLKFKNGTYEREFRRAQLVALFQPGAFGRYSRMHRACEYVFGTENELTMKLGYVYVKCLDAAKAGIVLKPEVDHTLRLEFENALGNLAAGGVIPLPPWTSYVLDNVNKSFKDAFGEQEKRYLPLIRDNVLETIAQTACEERRELLQTLRNLEVESNDTDLTGPWLSFTKSVESSVNHATVLWHFIDSNVQKTYAIYKRELQIFAERKSGRINLEEAWKTFWIEGQFSKALEAVKHDPYSYHFLQGNSKVRYNLIRASATVTIASRQDFFPFYIVFDELCHLKASAAETKHQGGSGAARAGCCPRAFVPEFSQAMSSHQRLLPPEKEDSKLSAQSFVEKGEKEQQEKQDGKKHAHQ